MTLSPFRLHAETPDAIANRIIQKAHNRDGLPEIAVGLFFLSVAGLNWLHATFDGKSPFGMAALCMMLLSPAILFVLMWAIKQVRARFLIEKLGYVKLKPLNKVMTGIVMGVAVVSAVATALAMYSLVRVPGAHLQAPGAHLHSTAWDLLARWSFAGTGVFGGALCVVCGRLPRFIVCGAVMAATGIALAFTGVSVEMGMAILYGVAGSLGVVSGVVVLSRFLHQPAEPAQ
jgi:hypothetical protein